MGTGSQKCTEEPCIPQECGSSPSSSGKKLEWSSDLKVGEGRECSLDSPLLDFTRLYESHLSFNQGHMHTCMGLWAGSGLRPF